jgi:hypothetical protein
MSLPADAIAWHEAIVANLAQQMMELRALRRAVRLQIVRARSRPAGSARRSRRPLTASSFGRHIEAATT